MLKKLPTYRVVVGVVIACALILAGLGLYLEEKLSARHEYKNLEQILEQREILKTVYHAEPIRLKTPDSILIAGLVVKREKASRIFIVCHGYKHTKERMADFAALFPLDTLIFIDFRGQGESCGNRVSLGLHEHQDIITTVEYAKKHISATLPVVGIGISQGGAAVLRAAAYGAPFDAVISDSAPSDFTDTILTVLSRAHHIPWLIGWLALWWYEVIMAGSFKMSDYRTYARQVTCPVLIMHDEHDHLIHFCHAEQMYEHFASKCKELWRVNNTYHGRMFKQIPEVYSQKIEAFLQRCLR